MRACWADRTCLDLANPARPVLSSSHRDQEKQVAAWHEALSACPTDDVLIYPTGGACTADRPSPTGRRRKEREKAPRPPSCLPMNRHALSSARQLARRSMSILSTPPASSNHTVGEEVAGDANVTLLAKIGRDFRSVSLHAAVSSRRLKHRQWLIDPTLALFSRYDHRPQVRRRALLGGVAHSLTPTLSLSLSDAMLLGACDVVGVPGRRQCGCLVADEAGGAWRRVTHPPSHARAPAIHYLPSARASVLCESAPTSVLTILWSFASWPQGLEGR